MVSDREIFGMNDKQLGIYRADAGELLKLVGFLLSKRIKVLDMVGTLKGLE